MQQCNGHANCIIMADDVSSFEAVCNRWALLPVLECTILVCGVLRVCRQAHAVVISASSETVPARANISPAATAVPCRSLRTTTQQQSLTRCPRSRTMLPAT
jgi:hypothetical protein